ncbi:MAG: SGNH/GDSL hydrolase family protein [Ruminococcaceae bacterium]|nr:SGNH/GDSL hydrolase family protein [Oscillospiraceae bacterium]
MCNSLSLDIFGDSIMKGVLLDDDTQRYVLSSSAPGTEFAKEMNVDVNNRSVFGCTVAKGSKLVSSAIEKGKMGEGLVLIEYGGNDCNYNWKDVAAEPDEFHDPVTPLKLFEKLYSDLIESIKSVGATPVIMSLPPIDAQKYFNWITKDGLSAANILKWLGDVQMIYRFQELYSNAISKIAYKTNSLFIDVRSYFLDKHNYADLLCTDGIHPNSEGQKLITQAMTDFYKTSSIYA